MFQQPTKTVFAILVFSVIQLSIDYSDGAAVDRRRPNIVLIMADDLGCECLQSYGGSSYETPNLSRIALEGTQFNHCYSTPICTTSRVQMMTGKYNHRNYQSFAYLDPSERTFGHLLQDAGYKTLIAGKWQLNGHNAKPRKPFWDDQSRPQKAGFGESYLWQVHERKRERYWGADLVINGKPRRLADGVFSPDYFADQICSFIERNQNDEFFIYYPMVLTHAPFITTPESESGKKTKQQNFADMVAYTDSIVGRIDKKLRDLELSENTLLIFTGDNGTDRKLESVMNGQVVKGGKALTINAGMHVPLICKWPGMTQPNSKIESLVDFTDFYPSFAELVDGDRENESVDGVSFLPALTHRPGRRREFVFCHYDCRWGNFPASQFAFNQRLKVYRNGQIFDTNVDPLENNPIAVGSLDAEGRGHVEMLRNELGKMPKLKVAAGIPGPRQDFKAEKPNIILLMADDLGWGDVGFNGNKIIKTPNLDQMAASGIKFERFYSQSAVCSPTRGSCLTGRHAFRYGIYGANVGHLKASEYTLAELLKQHGYRAAHFGKWHLGTLDRTFSGKGESRHPAANFMPPTEAGFDHWFSTEFAVATWDPYDPVNAHSKENAGDSRLLYWQNGKNVKTVLEGDDSRIIMDRTIPFVEKCNADKMPFFAAIWFHAPHKPVVAGPEYRAKYAEHAVGAQHYFGCITAMDEQIGRLRRCLVDQGISENTMLCFCSDNGPEGRNFGIGTNWGSTGGLRGRKRSLYEGGIRVPAVIEWPSRIRPGSTTNVPAVTSDYFPTVAEVIGCDLDVVRECDGMSLNRLFNGAKRRFKPIGFVDRKRSVLLDNNFKLIVATDGQIELYDLSNDPREENNIAESNSQLTDSLNVRLDQWRRSFRRNRHR